MQHQKDKLLYPEIVYKYRDWNIENHQKVEEVINKNIEMKKNIQLNEILIGVDRSIELIYRGIVDNDKNFQAEGGISGVRASIEKIKTGLNLRYNKNPHPNISESIEMIDYILDRLNQWQTKNNLLKNKDAEIFLDRLNNQLSNLKEMLKESDEKFNG